MEGPSWIRALLPRPSALHKVGSLSRPWHPLEEEDDHYQDGDCSEQQGYEKSSPRERLPHMIRGFRPLHLAAVYLGHEDISMTMKYTHTGVQEHAEFFQNGNGKVEAPVATTAPQGDTMAKMAMLANSTRMVSSPTRPSQPPSRRSPEFA